MNPHPGESIDRCSYCGEAVDKHKLTWIGDDAGWACPDCMSNPWDNTSGPSPAGPEMATGVPGRVEEDRRGAEAHGAPAPTFDSHLGDDVRIRELGDLVAEPESAEFRRFRDAMEDAIFDAYAGGAFGEGWTLVSDAISKDEMKARIIQDPDKMRHVARIQAAAWEVALAWVETDELTKPDHPGGM